MIREVFRNYLARLSDVVFPGRNRARIVIGTDRKDERSSGYGDGGQDDAESATIDLVAGFDGDSGDPNYDSDASRIYISGKTNPDEYFGVEKGQNVEGQSAIVCKSDNVYIVSRNKTKIVGPKYSIVFDENGDVVIESDSKIEIKVGSQKVKISTSGIELDAGQNISGKIITDLDQAVGIDPVSGAQIISNFIQAPAAPVKNQKVIIK